MTDYPNMSYCMCSNTLAAMDQLMDAMEDVDFIEELNPDELRSFDDLIHVAKLFARRGQLLLDRRFVKNVEKLLKD
jgi:hypothetical protein